MSSEKLVIISDIHANFPALEAVAADIAARGLSAAPLCFLGDAVNLGPFPAETVALLRSLNPAFRVRGNHDRYTSENTPRPELERYFRCAGGADHTAWTVAALDGDAREWLRAAPASAAFSLGGADFRCFHASLDSDERALPPGSCPVNALCGHTHAPLVTGSGPVTINPGSVGGPLDGNTSASYAVVTVNGAVSAEVIRVPYDLEAYSSAMRRLAVPWGDEINAVVRRASFY